MDMNWYPMTENERKRTNEESAENTKNETTYTCRGQRRAMTRKTPNAGTKDSADNKSNTRRTQHTETSCGVESRLCLLQYSPGDVVGDVVVE